MNPALSGGDIALRLVLALLAGVLIGMDRGEHAQPAGLRTTVLVCVAAAAAMLQAAVLYGQTQDIHSSVIRLDLMRMPLGILTGMGFIGGGAILRRGDMVRGVTTAASLWLVTVIGLCFGGGQLALGIATTAIGFATLSLLKLVEKHLHLAQRGRIAIEMRDDRSEAVLAVLRRHGFALHGRQLVVEPGTRVCLSCTGRYRGRMPQWSRALVTELAQQPGMLRVEWQDEN